MFQLKFNEYFDELIEEPISYWKTVDDIPKAIKEFITTTSDSRILYNETTNKYYCPKCLTEIKASNVCQKCSQVLAIESNDKKVTISNIREMKYYSYYAYYYVFDVVDGNILLYILEEYVYYNNPLSISPYKMSNISINAIYLVLSDEIIDLKTNKHFNYKELEKVMTEFDSLIDEPDEFYEIPTLYEEFELPKSALQYLYTVNLDRLRMTQLYKYSNIWDLKEYLTHGYFGLSSLTYFPICFREFEYLVKMKLYKLAIFSSHLIKYKGSFKNTFGVGKEYYLFMKSTDIYYWQLKALRLYPTTDLNMLNFISDNSYLVKLIIKYIELNKVMSYLEEQGLTSNNLHEYADYIRCCEEMKLNLKDNRVLFPKHFIEQHDKIISEVVIANDPQIDERIKSLSDVLDLNMYEDDKYIICAADGVYSLVDESSQQSNCVRTYCDMVSNNECQIYFMRYKDNIQKSFITIEVRNGKVVQARTRFNQEPPVEAMNIIRKWEQTLIPIINSEDGI